MHIKIGLNYRDGMYRYVHSSPEGVAFLAFFLLDDVGTHPHYIQSALREMTSEEDEAQAHNATQYVKEEGVQGIVTFMYECDDEDEAMDKGYYFQIRADLVAQVLRGWEEQVLKEKPQSIEITIDGDDVKVVGVGKRAE
jgi:hypothetical protein